MNLFSAKRLYPILACILAAVLITIGYIVVKTKEADPKENCVHVYQEKKSYVPWGKGLHKEIIELKCRKCGATDYPEVVYDEDSNIKECQKKPVREKKHAIVYRCDLCGQEWVEIDEKVIRIQGQEVISDPEHYKGVFAGLNGTVCEGPYKSDGRMVVLINTDDHSYVRVEYQEEEMAVKKGDYIYVAGEIRNIEKNGKALIDIEDATIEIEEEYDQFHVNKEQETKKKEG